MAEEPAGKPSQDPYYQIWQSMATISFKCNAGCGRTVPHPAMLCNDCQSQVGAGHHPGGGVLPWEGRGEWEVSYTARPCQPLRGARDDEAQDEIILAAVPHVPLSAVIKAVAARYHVRVSVLATPAKGGAITQARRLVCYIWVEIMRMPAAQLIEPLCLKLSSIADACRKASGGSSREQAWQITREEGWLVGA